MSSDGWVKMATKSSRVPLRQLPGKRSPLVSQWYNREKKGGILMGNNNDTLICPLLDHGLLRDEKFSWLYFVLVRKPLLHN